MKKALSVLLVVLILASLAACNSPANPSASTNPGNSTNPAVTDPSGSEEPEISGKLVVWTYDSMVPEWSEPFKTAYPNVELDVQVVPKFSTKLTQALTTGVNLPDVVTIESTDYGVFTNHMGLEDLNAEPYNAQQYADQFLEFWWKAGFSTAGEFRVFPNAPGMGCTYYRRSLALEAFGTDDPTELEKMFPDWESVMKEAQAFKDKTGADILPGADFIYQAAIAQTGETLLDVDTMTFDANKFRAPLELALRAIEAGMPATSVTFADGMKEGTWFMYQDGSWGEQYTIRAICGADAAGVPNTNGDWGVMSTPGGNINKGGNGYAMVSRSQNKDAAWAYIKFMAMDKDVQANMLKTAGVYPGLIAAQETPFFEEEIEFFGGQKARLKYGELADSMIITPITPWDYTIKTKCDVYVGPVLLGEMTIDEAILKMAADVQAELRITVIPDPSAN